jgi:hypothetical protein
MAAAAETPALLLSRYSGTTRQSRRTRLRTDHRAVAEPGHSDGLDRLVLASSGSPVSFRAQPAQGGRRLVPPLSERRSAAVDGLSDADCSDAQLWLTTIEALAFATLQKNEALQR